MGAIRWFDEVDSTTRVARAENVGHGDTVATINQTAGRGRQDRTWNMEPGHGVALTLVLSRSALGSPKHITRLPLLVGVELRRLLESIAPTGTGSTVKWPNDVMLDGRKCAGVLVEGRPQDGWAVVGIGINLTIEADEFPPEIRNRATSVGSGATLDAATEALNVALTHWLAAPDAEVLAELERRDHLAGREVSWEGGTGTASGIAPDGSLIVTSPDGTTHHLHAGEVHLTPA